MNVDLCRNVDLLIALHLLSSPSLPVLNIRVDKHFALYEKMKQTGPQFFLPVIESQVYECTLEVFLRFLQICHLSTHRTQK